VAPRITIVVPTRERSDTLFWSLKTCVTQKYDDLEILVSDNASGDDTRDVVSSFNDARIRYINPGQRLGMSDHWEFALGHVTGEYVGIIGDDDGIMPGGLARAGSILARTDADALIWPLGAYYWPGYADPLMANHVSISVPRTEQTTWVDSRKVLDEVASFSAPHYLLPSPYWGLVHRRAIDRARTPAGTFFLSMTPDIYAGAAIAAVTTSYLRSNRILTLSGSSHHSNGASQVAGFSPVDSESPQTKFLRENKRPFHQDIAYSGSIPVLVAEVLLQVRDGVDKTVPIPDPVTIARAALKHPELLFNPASRGEIISSLRITAARQGRQDEVEGLVSRSARSRRLKLLRAGLRNVSVGNPIHACPPAITNIYEASLYVDELLTAGTTGSGALMTNARGRLTKIRTAARLAWARLRS
jgi:hypothetical protein